MRCAFFPCSQPSLRSTSACHRFLLLLTVVLCFHFLCLKVVPEPHFSHQFFEGNTSPNLYFYRKCSKRPTVQFTFTYHASHKVLKKHLLCTEHTSMPSSLSIHSSSSERCSHMFLCRLITAEECHDIEKHPDWMKS